MLFANSNSKLLIALIARFYSGAVAGIVVAVIVVVAVVVAAVIIIIIMPRLRYKSRSSVA